ncbi:MAG: 50S ribosomal protein L17 [Alphaproteobacteria bacterium]|nr:50S ribosomal protein L17 [Alphaproteobacteria bacterium]
MSGRKLNRTASHRRAMFSNMVNALIEHEQINTTLPKAKDLRTFAEKMVTLAKKGTLPARRQAFAFLRNDDTVKKLFDVLAKRYEKRPGGYTRVLKAGFRYGDMAPLAIIEYVDRDETAKGASDKERVKAMKSETVEAKSDAVKKDKTKIFAKDMEVTTKMSSKTVAAPQARKTQNKGS